MLTEYIVKRGFGQNRTKEYFAVETDGDTVAGVIAGPFENREQCHGAIDALSSLYGRRLACVGGHLVGWQKIKANRWQSPNP